MNTNTATNATNASEIVALLETCYKALQATTPDLPNVFIKLDHGRTLRAQVWGHFSPNAWTVDNTPRHEIMIASECLAAGAEQTLQTLVHEAVHALAEARGIQETSRQGRYHNRKFVKLAEELGLTYDAPRNKDEKGRLVPDERIGYSHVILTQKAKVEMMGLTDLLQKEITAWRGNGKFTPAKRKAVVHAYAIFVNAVGLLDVVQMGTTKYGKLAPYLGEHVALLSACRQGELEGYLQDFGGLVADADGFLKDEPSEYMGDLADYFPEVAGVLAPLGLA